jgi:hypothetical protein
MIFMEKDESSTSFYKVEKIGGSYTGWNDYDEWCGDEFNLYPNEGSFMQVMLTPNVLDRWKT